MDKYTLKTAFKKSFLGIVWRIEVDTAENLIAVETRNQDSGAPAFSTFDYRTGRSFIQEQPYGDRNWTLAGTADRKLIIRAYGTSSPEGAGIACMDAQSGVVLWEQFSYNLIHVAPTQIAVRHRNFAAGYEQYLDIQTGNLTPFNTSADKPTEPKLVLPQQYNGDLPEVLENFKVHGDIFYSSIGTKKAWAFHEKEEAGYRVRLVITSGITLLSDQVILSGLPALTWELFFVIGQHLFFIGNNKREIVSYLV